ncbi:cell wall protein-like [Oryza sativa Japonica Group]|uniref:Cell wall protein-like n=1 Tax=Oryza sativa subsp. japonica TaxID=39947 RepID=Q5QLY6_ORYSJ|nr:cell wall protein-like [Oryza sativa Japonica Group]BAD73566.1 cell wall protein-like [Oryza sativa Japonica Group]
MKRIVGSKLNVKKVNPSCLFVGAIPSYEPSDMFEDSLQRKPLQVAANPSTLLAEVPSAAPSSSPVQQSAAPPPPSASQRQGRPRPRLPSIRTPPVFVVVLSSFPVALVVGPPFVKPCSFVVCVRQVSRCSPVVVFVLGSASSSLVPASSRLRPRIAAEVVPSPFVSAVPEPSQPRPLVVVVSRLVAWCFACVLRVASVVLEVPKAWFAVVAEVREALEKKSYVESWLIPHLSACEDGAVGPLVRCCLFFIVRP